MALVALAAVAADVTVVGRASRVIPKANLKRAAKTMRLQQNDAVAENDRVSTAAGGRTRLVLSDGSLINVGSSSELVVHSPSGSSTATSIDLHYGRLRAWVATRTNGVAFEIRANTAVAGVLGTTLFIEATRDITRVANLSTEPNSRVRVTSANPAITGEVVLAPGEGTVVTANRLPSPPRRWTQEEMQTTFDDTDIQ
jgi:hypothetical protein